MQQPQSYIFLKKKKLFISGGESNVCCNGSCNPLLYIQAKEEVRGMNEWLSTHQFNAPKAHIKFTK